MPDSAPLVAVLAAGAASRFGGGKLDAMLAGKRVGQWVLDAVAAAGLPPPVLMRDPLPGDVLWYKLLELGDAATPQARPMYTPAAAAAAAAATAAAAAAVVTATAAVTATRLTPLLWFH